MCLNYTNHTNKEIFPGVRGGDAPYDHHTGSCEAKMISDKNYTSKYTRVIEEWEGLEKKIFVSSKPTHITCLFLSPTFYFKASKEQNQVSLVHKWIFFTSPLTFRSYTFLQQMKSRKNNIKCASSNHLLCFDPTLFYRHIKRRNTFQHWYRMSLFSSFSLVWGAMSLTRRSAV